MDVGTEPEHPCDWCGMEDGRWRGGADRERAIGDACLDLIVLDITDQFEQAEAQRQQDIFEERWRTIQGADPVNWAVHRFHNVPAPWCGLCVVLVP